MSLGPGPDEPLIVEVRKDASPSRRLIRVRGELDVATAPGLERRLDALIGRGLSHLVVDLADVAFCDLAGVRVLLRVDRALRAHGGHLTLFGPCPWVSRILAVLDLTDQLRIEPGTSGDGAGQDGAGSQR